MKTFEEIESEIIRTKEKIEELKGILHSFFSTPNRVEATKLIVKDEELKLSILNWAITKSR